MFETLALLDDNGAGFRASEKTCQCTWQTVKHLRFKPIRGQLRASCGSRVACEYPRITVRTRKAAVVQRARQQWHDDDLIC